MSRGEGRAAGRLEDRAARLEGRAAGRLEDRAAGRLEGRAAAACSPGSCTTRARGAVAPHAEIT
ncbi:hypothetical protein [Streptomyces diastatochromogenes]|uniref:hypothetical protein n=1 Tax=Streptomyces diastatochromogenes TaxID=42236 RepID=UPI0036C3E24B